MKYILHIIRSAIAALVLISSHNANAFTYNGGDMLLVFSKQGRNDVEFNIGTVSNLLGKASGTVIPITYDINAVKTNYNNSFSGVKCLLVAATSAGNRRVWCTDGDTNLIVTPMNMGSGDFTRLQPIVTTIGQAAAGNSTSPNQTFVVDYMDPSSFTYICVGGLYDENQLPFSDPGTLNDILPFTTQMSNPGLAMFFGIRSMPPPLTTATNLGYFSWSTNGALTFTAGPLQTQQAPLVAPSNVRIDRANGVSTVRFTTTTGQNYRLHYRPDTSSGSWITNSTTVSGDGGVKSLTDTNADALRFYRVETLR